VLLALYLLAAPTAKPPARIVIPRSLERARSSADLALPASIFDDPRLAAALGPLHPQPGAWVEYAIHSKDAGGVRARISILSALPDGRCWLELNAISEDVPPASVKLLLRGSTLAKKDIVRAFIWITGQAPIELPVDQLPQEEEKEGDKRPAPKVHRGAPETVEVRAGTFEKAETLRVGDTRLWRSAQVPLWGLVKAQSPRQTLELSARGTTGAHTVFPPGWGDEPAQGNGKESTK
jgi:hypothetical protein